MRLTEFTSSPCYCINLRRASSALTEYYNQALAPLQLSISQYSVLANLKAVEPCSVTELSAQTRLDRTTLVRNLKPLMDHGLISDRSIPGRRSRQLALTEHGESVRKKAKALWKQAQAEVDAYLGSDTLQATTATLLKIEKLIYGGGTL